MIIFPEGTRSPTGPITARNGAALLALRSGAPIVPVGIIGTEGMLSWRAIFGPRPRVTVRIGQPFTLGRSPTGPLDRAQLPMPRRGSCGRWRRSCLRRGGRVRLTR